MAFKLDKPRFEIHVDLQKSKFQTPPAQIIEQNNGGGTLSSESINTVANSDLSGRFSELVDNGLSPVKALIIATTEFVPIASGQDQNTDVSTINLNFGEDQSLAVTNVARLMELHRQIRQYILSISSQFISLSLGLQNSDSQVDALFMSMYKLIGLERNFESSQITIGLTSVGSRPNFEDFIDPDSPTISSTVTNIHQYLKTNSKVTVLAGNAIQNTGSVLNRGRRSTRGSSVFQIVDYTDLFTNTDNNTIVRSLIEYVVYDEIILEILRHLSGVTQLKYLLRDAFKLSTTRTNLNFSSESSIQDISALVNRYVSASTVSNPSIQIGDYGAGIGNGNSISYYSFINEQTAYKKDLIGSAQQITNFVVSLANDILLNDNIVHDESEEYDSGLVGKVSVGKGTVLKTRRGTLRASLSRIKDIKFTDLLVKGIKNSEKDRYNAGNLTSDIRQIWNDVYPPNGGGLSGWDDQITAYSEMLAAIAFDSVYALTARADLNLKLPTFLSEQNIRLNSETLPNNQRPQEASIVNYLKYVLGENLMPNYLEGMSTSDSQWQNTGPEFGYFGNIKIGDRSNVNELGVIGDFLNRVKEFDGKLIAEFETTDKFPGLNDVDNNYETVIEAYLEKAIENDDLNLEDLSNLASRYATVMEYFAEDILKLTNVAYGHLGTDDKSNLTPLGACTPSNICAKLAYDIGKEILDIEPDDYEGVGEDTWSVVQPHLGLIFNTVPDRLNDSFLSAFHGQLCSGALLDFLVRPGFAPSGLDEESQNQLIRSVGYILYGACEDRSNSVVLSLLTSQCNVKRSNISTTISTYGNAGQQTTANYTQMLRDRSSDNILRLSNLDTLSQEKVISDNENLNITVTAIDVADPNKFEVIEIYNTTGKQAMTLSLNLLTDGDSKLDRKHALEDLSSLSDVEEYRNYSYSSNNIENVVNSNLITATALTPSAKLAAGQLTGAGSTNNFKNLLRVIDESTSGKQYRRTASFKGTQTSPRGSSFFRFLIDDHLRYSDRGTYNQGGQTERKLITNPIGMLAADRFFDHLDFNFESSIARFAASGGVGTDSGSLDLRFRWQQHPRKYGPVLGLSLNNRAMIYHHLKNMALRNGFAYEIRTLAKGDSAGSDISSQIQFKVNNYQIEAYARGLMSRVVDRGGYTKEQRDNLDTYSEFAWYASTIQHKAQSKALKRERLIISKCMILMMHANHLKKYVKKLRKYIQEGESGLKTQLAINDLKQKGVYKESLKLNTRETLNSRYANYIREYCPANNFPLFSNNDTYNVNSLKLMFKILTQAGYGLKKNEKKGGGKTVLHVGITNSMLESLRRQFAEKDSTDYPNGMTPESYYKSTKIAINVFKKNQLSSYELLYPKVFIFDVSEFILDNDEKGNYLSHIKDYRDSWNLNDIIDNVTTTKFSEATLESDTGLDRYGNALNDNYEVILSKGLTGNISNKKVMINHLFDYAFKMYYDLLLGLGFTEENFPLDARLLNYNKINGISSVSAQALEQAFEQLKSKITLLYPAANVDPSLNAELTRVINAIKRSHIFGLESKVKKVFKSSKFERTFSILVNEKDFILHKDSVKKTFNMIYPAEEIKFEHTSKLQRPTVVDDFSSSGNTPNSSTLEYSTSVNSIHTVTSRYKQNCFPDYPEVYNYYISVSLLPSKIQD